MGCELLSPAGDFETALSAFANGADAVYVGLKEFSARAFAKNFSFDELESILRYAGKNGGKKVYVTFNTLVCQDEMDTAVSLLAKLEQLRVSGVIVQDLGVADVCRKFFPALELHASTQMVVHNLEGVMAMKELGFKRVVLSRELSFEEISSIAKRCGEMELEVFIHGALCYSISGLCLFSAIEKDRSGNRGKCAYCCRLPHETGDGKTLPFSMRDFRLGNEIKKLADAGVKSLKIEGRMKSPLYVSSVVSYYRAILDSIPPKVSISDIETVFSRNTTKFYFDGKIGGIIDEHSPLGHLGTEIGVVKRITKDREGSCFIRFRTNRALEKHDGLQFDIPRRPPPNEKAAKWTFAGTSREKVGFGISVMRNALSRVSVCQVPAHTDVEVLVPEDFPVKPGDKVYCSMSNAVKRLFKAPQYRPSDYEGDEGVDVKVTIEKNSISANGVSINCSLEPANDSSKTYAAVEKAFSRLGSSSFVLRKLNVVDHNRLYAPMRVLNELRRRLVASLESERAERLNEKVAAAREYISLAPNSDGCTVRSVVKIRQFQKVPHGDWDEIVVSIAGDSAVCDLPDIDPSRLRLALPVWNAELSYNSLRSAVKRFIRAGFTKWECADLATLRTLKQAGVCDITADWTLYAFNYAALSLLAGLGVKRVVSSPENGEENSVALEESGFCMEFLRQQSVPLFISLVKPAAGSELGDYRIFGRGELYVTTRKNPTLFSTRRGAMRVDLSWDPPLLGTEEQ